MNPLLEEFNTPFGTAPFSKIENNHYYPAFKKAIEIAEKEIGAIVENTDVPNFENTIEALEYSGELLDKISHIFFNINSAETSEEVQKIAKEVSPLLTNFVNDINLNETLFQKIKAVYEKKETLSLTPEQGTLLEKNYKNFVKNGANLNDENKIKLREIDKQLAQLSLSFTENTLAETNDYELHITDKSDLKGLPKGVIDAAALTAKQKNKEGWVFTLDYPSYIPFVTYADNRELREKISKDNGSKCFKNNKHNNEKNVLTIASLRHQRVLLLGYDSHAHFVLEEQMANTPENVTDFTNNLLNQSKPVTLKEFQELSELAQQLDGIDSLKSWDSSYYKEKLKKQLFDLNDEQLKPYFKLENVINGVFMVAHKLYGLNFEEIFTIDKYHEDVKTYKVTDENENLVAIFYGDYFPRKGKSNGAWMSSFNNQFIKNGKNQRPHIINVCNFTKPTETEPSLLTFGEVTTLFHEFGHALHGMLSNTTYPSLSGTNVYRDFVELPSQLLENWCYEKEALELFAFHYKTKELIPMELIEKIKASSNFMEATQMVRQISLILLDMAWHTTVPEEIEKVGIGEFERMATQPTQIYPPISSSCFSTSFAHIFAGGYSSGYYSYKWAEVLDADAFNQFKENGLFDKETALKFKENILSKGGTAHPMTLYKNFRGQEPDTSALLKRAGLLEDNSEATLTES